MMRVYVLNMHGHPMMPCTPRKARLLLWGLMDLALVLALSLASCVTWVGS